MEGNATKNRPLGLLLAAAVLVVMLVAGKFVADSFLYERTTYASLRAQIGDIDYKRSQLTLAQTSAQNVQSDIARVESAFVNDGDILKVVLPLEQQATSMGITAYSAAVAQDVTPPDTGKKAPASFQGTTLRIQGSGTLEALSGFVQMMQALPYFLRIESLTLQQAAGAELQVTIVVKFYSQPSQ